MLFLKQHHLYPTHSILVADRRCCEKTLAVLRKESETVLSVLEAFVYDPIVEFHGGQMRRAATAAIVAEHLRRHKTVDARLGALLYDHKTLAAALKSLSPRETEKLKIADAYRTVAMLRARLQGVYNYGPASRLHTAKEDAITLYRSGSQGEREAQNINANALSVEGYVEVLFSEATYELNLLRMYIGWMAFL